VRFQSEKPKQQTRWFSKGQNIVELAGALLVLVPMLVVVADFARVYFISIAVNNAARAGAQFGSQSTATATEAGSPSGMQKAACNDYGMSTFATCQANLSPTATVCTCGTATASVPKCGTGPYCKDTTTATYVTVNTTATYSTILNYPGFASRFTLNGQAIMQVQQ
jgi:TadE-like protein